MGWTQSVLPLWEARISERRQIGLFGAFHSVMGTGLGDQLYQILASGWAAAGARAAITRALPNAKLRIFMNILPQSHVLAGETMSSLALPDNRPHGESRPLQGRE